ncbi:hypothetical protein HDU76_002416 [Blyttiomyces sp. JEL0837]|nr:hypothetical protein HDU76_002416 [Blyttiomyces sp. JEL0837]
MTVGILEDTAKPPSKTSKVAPTTSTSTGKPAAATSTTNILFGLVPVVLAVAFIAYKVMESQ